MVKVAIPWCVRLIQWRAFSLCSKLESAVIMNCETWWAPDSFLSTEKKVQVVCIATRRFSSLKEDIFREVRAFAHLFGPLIIESTTLL